MDSNRINPSASQAQSQKTFSEPEINEIRADAQRVSHNGGRALNAIWYLPGLVIQERMILIFLGSECNFEGTFTEFLPVSKATIVEFTGIGKTTIDKYMHSLIGKGYLSVTRVTDQLGASLPNEYALTKKVFIDYEEILVRLMTERKLKPSAASLKRIVKGVTLGRVHVVEGGRVHVVEGEGPPAGPLFSPSSSAPDADAPKTEEKPPLSNDDVPLIPTSDVPETEQKDAGTSSSLKEGCIFAIKFDWLYARNKKGDYTHKIANEAAERFLAKHAGDKPFILAFEDWLWKQEQWDGRVRVKPTMFDFLEREYRQ